MIIKGSTMSSKPLARAIWNELFKQYRKMRSDLNNLTYLLIDYETICHIVMSKYKEPFYWLSYTGSDETELLDDKPDNEMSYTVVSFLENGDVEILEIDLTVAEGNV